MADLPVDLWHTIGFNNGGMNLLYILDKASIREECHVALCVCADN